MLQEITIKNFKSIENDTIKLGRVNVFIGENGCGKSNILEAVAFLSAGYEGYTDNEHLFSKGIRLAKPELTISNFKKKIQKKKFEIIAKWSDQDTKDIATFNSNDDKIWNITGNYNFLFKDEESSLEFGEIYNLMREHVSKLHSGEKLDTEEYIKMIDSMVENNKSKINSSKRASDSPSTNFLIYALNTPALRGFTNESRKEPVGIYGENLDVFIANLEKEELEILKKYNYLIKWLADFDIDRNDSMKFNSYKPNRSKSKLFFIDKFMATKNNFFSVENANEGILHILFYLSVMISKRTPKFFAFDNIESCLNPHLCTHLMKEICTLAKDQDKQLLITTHNPAILDGLNLNNDEIRLFRVSRNKAGHTVTRRIEVKPDHEDKEGRRLKLSELWTRGYLKAISEEY